MSANVRHRREQILAIVSSDAIRSQDELQGVLARRGILASQASLSRDIAALGLIKVAGVYALPPMGEKLIDPSEARLRTNLLGVTAVGEHILVLKTPAGEASGVALAIDRLGLDGLAGTVAGDDTIFVAVADSAASARVAGALRSMSRVPALDDGVGE